MKKLLFVALAVMIFVSGCAVKSSVVGRSVCKGEMLFTNNKITVDCDSLSIKDLFTKYLLSGNWSVCDGPTFKNAEYTFYDGNSSANTNSLVSGNLSFAGKNASNSSAENSRKIVTNGQYDLKSDLLFKIDSTSEYLYIKVLDYKTQEIVFSCSMPNDDYALSYFDFIYRLHYTEKIKDIFLQEITRDRYNNEFSEIVVIADGLKKEYVYDSEENKYKLVKRQKGLWDK